MGRQQRLVMLSEKADGKMAKYRAEKMKSDTYLHIRIPAETKELAQQQALALGLSLSSYIKMLINQDAKRRK